MKGYPRAPRVRFPRFGCVGFLIIGWMFYAAYLTILFFWFVGLFFAEGIQLFLWFMNMIDKNNKRRRA